MANYSKHIYDKAWATLEARKNRARETAAARRAKVRAMLPEIAAIEREMAVQASSIAKMVIADPDRAEERIKALGDANLSLQRRRERLLAEAGYPADYLSEQYECATCQDAGFIGAKMCKCMAGLLRQEAAATLGRSAPIKDCTFERFSLEYYDTGPDETGVSLRERMRDKLTFCQDWAADFSPRSESMLLAGPTGVGKTHLSLAMAGRVSESGYSVVYTPVQRMMDFLEGEKFARDAQGREKFFGATDGYLDCDLLVLDDLGTELSTAFTSAALFNILNTRLVEERPTIISTNLELGEIKARYSQRIASRLIYGYKVLRFGGKDIRYIKKMERSQL
ncbi:MAG: ATP-binding protein [Oscillospiraceae bacterium]|nr:ATP-binding protein [Oscillospiraceae bacterium]